MRGRLAICEDSDADRAYLVDLVNWWAARAGHAVQVFAFSSAESFLFWYAEQREVDILLLDIEMGKMDGVTLAKRLRENGDAVQIVFITGYADYIAEGYDVAALHYLVKPVREEKLFSVLDRAAEKAAQNEITLHFDMGGEVVRIPIYRIRYAEGRGNYVTIHANTDCTVKMTLAELESKLDDRFHRAGRSVVVNLTQIARVTRSEIQLMDGTAIPLPRGAYEGVNRAIIRLR